MDAPENCTNESGLRKEWRLPVLRRHQSMTTLTRASVPGDVTAIAMAASMVMMQIGGSQGFFPAPPPGAPPGTQPEDLISGW